MIDVGAATATSETAKTPRPTAAMEILERTLNLFFGLTPLRVRGIHQPLCALAASEPRNGREEPRA
jgi:hypothetical protein